MTFTKHVFQYVFLFSTILFLTIGIAYALAYYWFNGGFLKTSASVLFFLATIGTVWSIRGKIDRSYKGTNHPWNYDGVTAVIFGLLYIICLVLTLSDMYITFVLR